MLEGSVRRANDAQLRVNAQLIDATTGGHIWADRFDGDTADVFAVQDQFVLKIVQALELKLTASEKSEIAKIETEQVAAREAFQQGWELYSRFNAADNAKSVRHFKRAVELDPEYGLAYGALALVHIRASVFHWHGAMGKTRAEVYRKLVPLYLNQAREHPTALVHVVAAMKHLDYWDRAESDRQSRRGADDARVEAGLAIALQPNDPEAHIAMAWALIAAGKPTEGLNFVQAALRLNPDYPSHYAFFHASAHFALGNLGQALSILKEGLERDQQATELAPLTASILAQLGQREEARTTIALWRPGESQTGLEEAAEAYDFPIEWLHEQRFLRNRLLDGLRLAALPLDATAPSLIASLEGKPPLEQIKAIRQVGWFGPSAAAVVPALIELLGNEQKALRKEAAITLGKIGPAAKAAVPDLMALTEEPIVGFHAKEALTRIGSE